MLQRILIGALGLLVLLVVIILFRTFTYGSGGSADVRLAVPEIADEDWSRAADNLTEAIRFKTIIRGLGDPMEGKEGPWLEFQDWLAATYPATHQAMTREKVKELTLLYRWEGSDPSLKPIILMAHQDVVPVNPGTEGDWDAPPFAGDIVDDMIVGRGTMDDKGSLIALMEAAERLTRRDFRPRRTIYFLFGHDEEVSGSGARTAFKLLAARGVQAEMVLDEGYLTVDPVPLTDKVTSIIGVAEKGYVTLEVIATGKGGHSSTPPRDNAVVRLSRAMAALDEHQMPAYINNDPLPEFFEGLGDDLPFIMRMAMANRWLFKGLVDSAMSDIPTANALIRTTTAPTMLNGSSKENTLPQIAEGVVNFRIHPEDSIEEVLAHARNVTSHIDNIEVRLRGGDGIGSEPSPVSSTDNHAYRVLSAIADHMSPDAQVVPGLVLGATDARYAGPVSQDSVYRYLPMRMPAADINGFHGTNERISVENLGQMIIAYQQLILMMDEAP